MVDALRPRPTAEFNRRNSLEILDCCLANRFARRWTPIVPLNAEFNAFVADNATGGGELLLSRITYELMASYWPTPNAIKDNPVVAEGMNSMPKVVFSRTLDKASWNNTQLVKGEVASEVRRMKNESGKDIVILGSGSIVSQLAPEGLIDEYQVVMHPVILGKGRTMFHGIGDKLTLKLTKTRTFKSGKVFLCYGASSV